MKTKHFLLIAVSVMTLAVAAPALAQNEVEDTTTAIDAAKPDNRGNRDFRENRRDRREDYRDRHEDRRDRDGDRFERRHGPDSQEEGYEGKRMKGPKDNVKGRGKGKGLSDDRREAIREKLESLSPEERKAEIAKMRAEHKEKMEKRYEERKKRFDDRWDNASDDERTNICERAAERCADIMGSKMCEEIMGKCQ